MGIFKDIHKAKNDDNKKQNVYEGNESQMKIKKDKRPEEV